MRMIYFSLMLCLVAMPASADDFTVGDLKILRPTAFATPKTAMSGGGYMAIENSGTATDRLIAVKADFPRVMIHTTIETDGIARMMHVDAVEVTPGETVVFEPGGLHIMFMGLNGDPFEIGDEIPATLVFENAGEVEVTFEVQDRASAVSNPSGQTSD